MTDKTPTDAQQYLNVASQCAATATSELAKNVLVDDGSGTLRELLNDAADAIRAGWGQPAPAQAQADSVQEDAARLDWLDKQIKAQDLYTGFGWRAEGSYEENMGLVGKVQAKKEKMTARQAIDAARKQGASHD